MNWGQWCHSSGERTCDVRLMCWGTAQEVTKLTEVDRVADLGRIVSGLRLIQIERRVERAHGQFEVFLVDDAGDFYLGCADHHDIDAFS